MVLLVTFVYSLFYLLFDCIYIYFLYACCVYGYVCLLGCVVDIHIYIVVEGICIVMNSSCFARSVRL